ncbi:MAG TPA: hypothetical protein VLE73_02920 [Candidatus Saccharimonadales bacterium]|nr:hypothetical protein [Candidatus Saccharimonadales bacterium]
MHVSSRQFLDACKAQQLHLHDKVEGAIRRPVRARQSYDTYMSPLVIAIEDATWIAETTDEPIANKPIVLEQLPPDPVMRLLADIANAALRPRIQPKLYENISPVVAEATCRDADNKWSSIFYKIANNIEKPGVEIFTEGSVIVALRKVKGNANGLLLQPRRLGQLDYVFPAGTTLHVETSNEPSPLRKEDIDMPFGLKHTNWSLVTRLGASRPSMYALPREYRKTHFGTHRRVVKSIDLEYINQLAEQALAQCALYR